MKKIIYSITIIVLLILISIIPTSAKEIETCTRTSTDLKVPSDVEIDDINAILNTPCVDDMDKIYDFANLLTDSEEELLYDKVIGYINSTDYDLVLVTTDENIKNSAMKYADDFYDYNHFGKNKSRDGVLILIDMATRELYISTSGYAIKMYDDYRIERILDSGYNYITNEKYYDTFNNMIESLNDYYLDNYPDSNEMLLIDKLGKPYYIKYISYEVVFIVSSIITLIVSLVLYFKSRLKVKRFNTVSYLKSIEITKRNDTYVNSHVSRVLRASESSSSSSGSSRGGSSYHRSSSGRSHGGGGRKF